MNTCIFYVSCTLYPPPLHFGYYFYFLCPPPPTLLPVPNMELAVYDF